MAGTHDLEAPDRLVQVRTRRLVPAEPIFRLRFEELRSSALAIAFSLAPIFRTPSVQGLRSILMDIATLSAVMPPCRSAPAAAHGVICPHFSGVIARYR